MQQTRNNYSQKFTSLCILSNKSISSFLAESEEENVDEDEKEFEKEKEDMDDSVEEEGRVSS